MEQLHHELERMRHGRAADCIRVRQVSDVDINSGVVPEALRGHYEAICTRDVKGKRFLAVYSGIYSAGAALYASLCAVLAYVPVLVKSFAVLLALL